jgi:hypothetical protein
MTRSFAAAACLGLAILAVPALARAQTALSRRVTIDVTESAPRHVVELLARAVGCRISDDPDLLLPVKKMLGIKPSCFFWVDPAVTQPLTMRLVDVPVYAVLPMICQSIRCEYRFDGTNVWIKPLSNERRSRTALATEWQRKLGSPLPENMRFDNTPLVDVLSAVGKASGLELWPWRNEADRKVTTDVSGETVSAALESIVSQVGGEGAVLIRTWQGSIGQMTVLPNHGKLDWPPSEWNAYVRDLERRRR